MGEQGRLRGNEMVKYPDLMLSEGTKIGVGRCISPNFLGEACPQTALGCDKLHLKCQPLL